MEKQLLQEKIFDKAIEVANNLFATEEKYLSKEHLNNLIGDELKDYSDLITRCLLSIKKIKGRQKAGGITFAPGRGIPSRLVETDEKIIKKFLKLELSKKKNSQPELNVQNAFENWLRETEPPIEGLSSLICKFNSNNRKGEKWKNVDGYLITVQKLQYHLSFKPILTTFEVKPSIPDVEGISQARNYLNFSNHVYLVFEDGRSRDLIMDDLHKRGFNDSDGMGVYIRKNKDSDTFEKIQNTNSVVPSEWEVENVIEKLLDTDDKNTLLKMRLKYIREHVRESMND